MDILFGVGGEEEKGKSSHHLMAVLSGMNITNTRHSIFNRKNLVQIAWMVIPSFSFKILHHYVIRMISDNGCFECSQVF